MADPLPRELRRLARLLKLASASVENIAAELERDRTRVTAPVAPPVEPPTAAVVEDDDDIEPPWDALVERARSLLSADPTRVWKPAELTRAVRDSGVALRSLQGVHFGVMARLRALGVVKDDDGGFTFAAAAPSPEPAEALASVAPIEPSAQSAEQPPREIVWADLIAAALKLLRYAPARIWDPEELTRAVQNSGLAINGFEDVPQGLSSRLTSLGLATADENGKLRLSTLAGGRTPSPDPEPEASDAPDLPQDEIDDLTSEIDACELFLEGMTDSQRSAQVAIWAGRARALQDALAKTDAGRDRQTALRRVFGRLTRITREQRCGWIDALTPDFVVNWDVYVEFYSAALAGEEPLLNDLEQQSFWRGKLRGLLLPARKHVSSFDSAEVIANATAVLPAGDEDLLEAVQRFGPARVAAPPQIRRARPVPAAAALERTAAPEPELNLQLPAALVATTRGKRAVVVGGQGAREEHRRAMQTALGFSELDWVFSERGSASHYARLEERVKHGSYDLVFFLAGYTSHKSAPFLRQCKQAGVPLVYLSRGYSLTQVVRALEQQWMARDAVSA